MASSIRGGRSRNDNIEPDPLNPRQTVLHVAPLNSVPYIGPPTPHSYTASSPAKKNSETVEKVGPAMIFLPSLSTREEWNNAVAATKVGVALTGSAAMGKIGPVVGPMDIGESDDSYFFRVSLPGVTRDEKDFSCEVEPDGKIVIKGVTTTGEKIVCKNSQIFQMQSQNLCPPGHFSISFQLPGPVDNQQFSGSFGIDGILEGIVKKSEGTLKLEQREFGPQLRAPPFVAARKNAIMVPGYYAAKRKEVSGASTHHGSGRSSVSGRGKLPEQSQGVTVSTANSIDGDNISSLMRNKMNGNRKEDSGLKAKVNEEIMEESSKLNGSVSDLEITVELNKNNGTVSNVEANNEEVCLAKEFGAAKLLGSGKSATKNPTSRDNLIHLSQLKKSRDSLQASSLHLDPIRVASTRTRREGKIKGNTAETKQPLGKKRDTRVEADLPVVSAKRFQVDPRNEKSPSVVARAVVQPRQQQ